MLKGTCLGGIKSSKTGNNPFNFFKEPLGVNKPTQNNSVYGKFGRVSVKNGFLT